MIVDLLAGTGIVGRVWESLSADADASLSADGVPTPEPLKVGPP